MTLDHDLLKLARDAMRSLMNGREFATGQTGHYLNIIRRIEDELNRPKPEPVAWMLPEYGDVLPASQADGTGIYNIPLYTAPPRKEWVGLTEDEVSLIYAEPQTHVGQYARAIEAKLKEKNSAL